MLSSFCRTCGAPNNNIFPAIESMKQSPLYKALHATFVPELVNVLYDNELMKRETIYLTPNQAGGQSGGQAGGQASHATDPNKPRGVHHSKLLQRDTMSTIQQGQAGGQASHATDPNKPHGVHHSKRLRRDTTSSRVRAQAAAQARTTSQSRWDANLKKLMNGTAHLNPNAKIDFNTNCASIKRIFEEVNLFGCQWCL